MSHPGDGKVPEATVVFKGFSFKVADDEEPKSKSVQPRPKFGGPQQPPFPPKGGGKGGTKPPEDADG